MKEFVPMAQRFMQKRAEHYARATLGADAAIDEEVQEASQEVLGRLLTEEKLKKYFAPSPQSWSGFTAIANSLLDNKFKEIDRERLASEKYHLLSARDAALRAGEGDPVAALEAAERVQKLHEGLGAINPRDADVLRKHHSLQGGGGGSFDEIATENGESETNARFRASRGEAHLKHLLRALGPRGSGSPYRFRDTEEPSSSRGRL